ncbi:hypothetical protein JCM19233_4789 [Vibrio astriarenae]|nr:hypothetical protein JCM19233_4789 [Vibrio sp. C7]
MIRLYNKASNNLNQLAHQANLHNQKGTVSQELMTRIALTLNSIEGLLKSGIEYVD